jgi:LEA14-like dessication related protein
MTKKFIIPTLLTIISLTAVYSQPKLSVVGNSIIDLGNVYNTGSHILKTFQIKNTGDQPLHIKEVKTSCGCTAALLSDSLLKPLSKSKIKVDFNPMGYSGDVTKYIYVMSDDPKNQMATLQLKMHILYAVQSTPNFILFQNAKVGKPDTSSVTLTNNSNKMMRITGVETNAKEIASHFDGAIIKPGESTRLELYLVGEKVGPVAGSIIVNTTSRIQPTLTIRYYAGVNEK